MLKHDLNRLILSITDIAESTWLERQSRGDSMISRLSNDNEVQPEALSLERISGSFSRSGDHDPGRRSLHTLIVIVIIVTSSRG